MRGATAETEELALSVDLSLTGMRLRRVASKAAEPIIVEDQSVTASGPVIHLEFELPDGGDTLRIAGRLLFERVDGSFRAAGVRFLELGIDDELRIASFVALSTLA